MVTIAEQVKTFYPDYDDAKATLIINFVKAIFSVNANRKYPVEGTDTDLDVWVAMKAKDLIRREEEGYIKARSIGGQYSETLSATYDGLLSDIDKMFIAAKAQIFETFTYDWKTFYNDYYLILGY